ncbi:MAG: hypothetical protein HOV83_33235 [Catenulispora sp.]|nr:hypothetical protein [Catenulispora sp.]
MRLLLVFALALSPVGAIMCWAGVNMLRERWVLLRRGVRVPAVAERWVSRAGAFGVYRFMDTGGKVRFAEAERLRSYPAAEVEIVYDPQNVKVARESQAYAELLVGVLCLVVGAIVTVSALFAIVLAIAVFV